MKYNELPEGSYFKWKDKTYRKIPGGNVLQLDNDSILAFGFGAIVEPVNRPASKIALVIQYLHWALIQAHAESDPRNEFVYIKLDLKRKQATSGNKKFK